MIVLDMKTIIFSHICTSIVCVVVMYLLWRQNRTRYAGLGLIVTSFALQGGALLLIVLRGFIPDWSSIVLSNIMVVSGALLNYIALERFVGKLSSQMHNYLLLMLFAAVHWYFTFIDPNLAVRSLNTSVALLLLTFQCVWLLFWRIDPGMRSLTRQTGLVFGAYCLLSVFRIVTFPETLHQGNDYFHTGPIATAEMVTYQLLLILLTYTLVLMVNHRLIMDFQGQEEKFAKAFHSAPYAITLTRLSDGFILDINDGFVNITGYQREEVLGESTVALQLWTHMEDREQVVHELLTNGYFNAREFEFRKKSGEMMTGLYASKIINIDGYSVAISSISDITERKQLEQRQKLAVDVFYTLNNASNTAQLVDDILKVIKTSTGVEAVGLRLRDGNDFPYFTTEGFPDHFVAAERFLCSKDEQGNITYDSDGKPVLECMCGNILNGRFDAALPSFTEGGSFWTNSTSSILSSPTEQHLLKYSRNYCNREGYESLALIPLRQDDKIIGLLQLNDHRVGMFTQDMITFIEGIVASIAIALAHRQAVEQLATEHTELQLLLKEQEKARLVLLNVLEDQQQAESARAQMEEQIRQQQRLETVGQLAAGIAHDFNNILTGISGFTQFALDDSSVDSPIREDLTEVIALAKRAADLTRQLLAFSRKQTLQPEILNINRLVGNMAKMLKRLIGEHIELDFFAAADLGNVKVDPGQIEQVLVNLVINARDAMPDGGKLTIETLNVELDEEYVQSHAGTRSGSYIQLSITDTGCGMTASVLEHIFEPFYTTKGVGKGTGLGLATVYGIVKQHNGHIWAYSEPGLGSTFKVYLPRVDELPESFVKNTPGELFRGNETILLVEDEFTVREVAARILNRHGYRVLTAALPSEARQILAEQGDGIDLLLTDVVMPECNGRQLYESVAARFPQMRVLYMSGYTTNAIEQQGVLDSGTAFLQKPFTENGLAKIVREVLDGSKAD